MGFVQRHRKSGSGLRRFAAAVAAALAVSVVMVALLAASATAAPASRSTRAVAGSMCGVSKTVAGDIAHSTSLVGPASTPSYLKTVYGKIQAAEPTILAAASGKLKTDFRDVFRFINIVIGDLKQANWSVLGLAPHEKALLAAEKKVEPQLTALKRYYNTTCKFK